MDDGNNIYQNSSINNFWDSFTPPETVNIFRRQAVNVTLAVNYAISRHEVWSYHLFNLCFHLLAALALFGIVKQIFFYKGKNTANTARYWQHSRHRYGQPILSKPNPSLTLSSAVNP